MKIETSAIGMESARSYRTAGKVTRHFKVTEYQGMTMQENRLFGAPAKQEEKEEDTEKNRKTGGPEEVSSLSDWQRRMGVTKSRTGLESRKNTAEELRQLTVKFLFELLFAQRRKWENRFECKEVQPGVDEETKPEEVISGAMQERTGTIRVMDYVQDTWQYEAEQTDFKTTGTVKTADGRELNFQVSLSMSREFESRFYEDLQTVSFKMCDPLVINLDSSPASVSDMHFYFDIDADGEEDEISSLGAGSGFLALDKNEDGVINDGRELFGTKSGDGFRDLAEYDEDGNGWIDENDSIFAKLKIWCFDEKGEGKLYSLADKGVGAICLQNADTEFSLKNPSGMTNAAIRKSGVFLYENGLAGTIQHVDMVKHAYQKEA